MKQLVVGVTGGIGCGMSAVANRLAEFGAKIVNVDKLGRTIVEQDDTVIAQLKEAFGKRFFNSDGELDRSKLGKLVFSDPKAREKLNAIVHPPMISQTRAEILQYLADPECWLVIIDAALFFELNMDDFADYAVVVASPLEVRVERIKARDSLSGKEIVNRIYAQRALEEKIAAADYVVLNEGSLMDLDREVQSLFRWLKVRAENDTKQTKPLA